jgi:hypothetical protein
MATPRKRPEDKVKTGRPTDYDPKYCTMLVTHMREGGSLESFGAKITGCTTQTLYNWLDSHPEFFEARKEGMTHLHTFYENLGKTIAAGQLRRLKSERPMIDKKGKPILDPNTGQVMYDREYEATTAGQSVFIFMTKNLLNWRDKKDIELSGKDGGAINFTNMSDDELKKQLAELQDQGKKYLKK